MMGVSPNSLERKGEERGRGEGKRGNGGEGKWGRVGEKTGKGGKN